LQHRWGGIQRETSRFCRYYTQVERKKVFAVQVKDALQMYDGIARANFPYMHCWLILRNERKWSTWMDTLLGRQGGDPKQSGEGSSKAAMPPPTERPMGHDKAKKQRSESTSSSSMACLEVLQ
ncbi:hypothetical protein BAE44_0020741, partial [Dichanthelium oligosanthes]